MRVCVIGPTGVGKSALCNLLCGKEDDSTAAISSIGQYQRVYLLDNCTERTMVWVAGGVYTDRYSWLVIFSFLNVVKHERYEAKNNNASKFYSRFRRYRWQRYSTYCKYGTRTETAGLCQCIPGRIQQSESQNG